VGDWKVRCDFGGADWVSADGEIQVVHCINRCVRRAYLCGQDPLTGTDYEHRRELIRQRLEFLAGTMSIEILGYSIMSNHFHCILRGKTKAETSDQVSEFFRRLTVMHTMRWHAHDKTGGTGHLYQGRFKSFPIQTDGHLLTVMRYVERNPVRANLIELAEHWPWGSAYARMRRADERRWLAISRIPRCRETGVHG